MHPVIHDYLIQARTADLHRKAEQDRRARAAGPARRHRADHGIAAAPGRLAALIFRRVLTPLAAHRLRLEPSRPGQAPDASS